MNLLNEFKGASLGDARLEQRLLRIAAAVCASPEKHFPQLMTEGDLEGFYRFIGNEEVTPEAILAPHVEQTAKRCEGAKTVLVAHDTSEFGYSTEREGMGRITEEGQGFFAHYSLAMSLDGEFRKPLGVLNLRTHVRLEEPRRKKGRHTERRPPEERESIRWLDGVVASNKALAGKANAIHLMDREGDSYTLLAELQKTNARFIIRIRSNRRLATEDKLFERLSGLTASATRSVHITSRMPNTSGGSRRTHPPRDSREAKLEIAAGEVILNRPQSYEEQKLPPTLTLHAVHVREVDVPEGCAPVDWKLFTLEPITSKEDVETVVDGYRARWLIEEFFKALKTGCSMEKRQLESLDSMLNALAIVTPIAVELLTLRYLSRAAPSTPATHVLRPLQIAILKAKLKLKSIDTAQEAALAVARLGGHLKRNGPPGWSSLGGGYHRLLALEEGANLRLEM